MSKEELMRSMKRGKELMAAMEREGQGADRSHDVERRADGSNETRRS